MHDGPTQGHGHEPFKVGNPAIFNSYVLLSPPPFTMGADN